ncbi:hypothetical protein AJ78_03135 [Emergomyces pasteurianus Ep9510]|uniref:DUF6604 domain-containing protein n=1 Tax=Emergomyces pasteurianus Ep9510 TaxID=1447872 RepID=A0A1J9PKV0_9EURO|nr:hypothetical protein AJ78_03135 [Emergomyces pasteurianus Ep9510]
MLADLKTSSYLQYKANTDTVASWLAITARERGYLIDLQTENPGSQRQEQEQQSKRLEGTSRKQVHEAETERKAEGITEAAATPGPKLSTSTLPVKEFTRLAKYVAAATDTPVIVPANIVIALDRAITTRREYSTELASRIPRDEESKASDDRHAHFIEVLEQVREILRPRFVTKQGNCPADNTANKPTAEPIMKIIRNISNKFEGLDVQESSKEFADSPGVTPTTAPSKVKEEVNNEEQSPRDEEENCFRIEHLLQDCGLLQIILYIPKLDVGTTCSK